MSNEYDQLDLQIDSRAFQKATADTAVSQTSASGDQRIDGLVGTNQWVGNQLTYSFPTSGAAYGASYGIFNEHNNGFVALDSGQQAAAREIFEEIASYINLVIAEEASAGTIRIAETNVHSFIGTAYAYYPGNFNDGRQGDVWLNHTDYTANQLIRGNSAWRSLSHELTHALGLVHGHEQTNPYGPVPDEYDSHEYSIMTYNSYIGDTAGDGYENGPGSHPQTLMMLDIAALQHLYGADYSTNSGDTTYKFSETTGELFLNGAGQGAPEENIVFRTVWDGGGQDTYDLSNYENNVVIDLTPGGHTITNTDQLAYLGGGPNGGYARGNVFNALLYNNDERSLIENAISGAGDDTLTGNQADNLMIGGTGADTLNAGDGNDQIFGDEATVQEANGRGLMVVELHSPGTDPHARTDADIISGGNGNDRIEGDDGNDELHGDAGDDRLYGQSGDDLLYGGADNDFLVGDSGNDSLYGQNGSDRLFGGAGDDVLAGGEGNDLLRGGMGQDRFVFSPDESGTDTVADFVQGEDLIDISDFDDVSSISDINFTTRDDGMLAVELEATQIFFLSEAEFTFNDSDFLF